MIMQASKPVTISCLVFGVMTGWFLKGYWVSRGKAPEVCSNKSSFPISNATYVNSRNTMIGRYPVLDWLSEQDCCDVIGSGNAPTKKHARSGLKNADITFSDVCNDVSHHTPLLSDSFRDGLIRLGIDESTAEAIIKIIWKNKMKLLELRRTAIQEGWFDTQQYINARGVLADPDESIRSRFGGDVYRSYLYLIGKPNLVFVKDVYPDSIADNIGMMPGDVVLSYGGSDIIEISDLIEATTRGSLGESTIISFKRKDTVLYETVQRGVLGVELGSVVTLPAQ